MRWYFSKPFNSIRKMATCRLTAGHARACEFQIGGITQLFAANKEDIVSWTLDPDGTYSDVVMVGYTITGVTNANPAVVTAVGHKFIEGDLVFITGASSIDGLVGQHTVGTVTSTTFELADFDSTALDPFAGSTVRAERGWFEFEFDQETSSISAPFTVSNGNRFFTHTVQFKIGPATNDMANLVDQLCLTKTVWMAVCNDGTNKVFFDELGGQVTAAPFTSGVAFGDFAGYDITITGASKRSFRAWSGDLPVFEN